MGNLKRCLATGKVIFSTKVDANITMFRLKWGFKHIKDHNGKRIKRRQGKPKQKRAYYCPYCEGYHLTKWKRIHYKQMHAYIEK